MNFVVFGLIHRRSVVGISRIDPPLESFTDVVLSVILITFSQYLCVTLVGRLFTAWNWTFDSVGCVLV
jgi:hypothetical protein